MTPDACEAPAMTLRIYDSLQRRLTPFAPLTPGQVKIYLCGPTVYDDPHLGHARGAVVFDVVRRYLEVRGYAVTLVRNVTDIDDKLLVRAGQQGRDYRSLATHYLHRYQAAMARLNVRPPEAEPRATAYIKPIIDNVDRLVQGGHAYHRDGSVYFSTAAYREYGKLSGRTFDSVPIDGPHPLTDGKRNPADFALWKASKPEEPFWPNPWGAGRPGWHIECSTMSAHLLGETFDIHGGGVDLIFPHHENEIAQSKSLFKKPPANYWMHHGLVHTGGSKISKSQGRFETLNALLDTYPPDALRLLLLSKRYRHPLDFSPQNLKSALKNISRIYRFFSAFGAPAARLDHKVAGSGPLWSRFCRALDDDFNFPMALAFIFAEIRRINHQYGTSPPGQENRPAPPQAVVDLFLICTRVLGFHLDPPTGALEGV